MPIYSYFLYRTPWGVHLRAVGEDEAAAEAAGIHVTRTKFVSVLFSGILCGFAGAQLAMATLGSFTAGHDLGPRLHRRRRADLRARPGRCGR